MEFKDLLLNERTTFVEIGEFVYNNPDKFLYTPEQCKEIAFKIFQLYCHKLPHPLIDLLLLKYKNNLELQSLQRNCGQVQVLFGGINNTLCNIGVVATYLCNKLITPLLFIEICRISSDIVGPDIVKKNMIL